MATSSVRDHPNTVGISIVCAACAALAIPLILKTPSLGDECYHYPLAVAFSRGMPVFADCYWSAYTPLPYMIAGACMKIFGTTLLVARSINLILGIVGIIGFYRLARVLNPGQALWAVIFLASYPYYLRNCSVYYMGNYATVLSVWALFFYLRKRNNLDTFLTAFLLGASTLAGQWSLAIVSAVVLCEILRLFDDHWICIRKSARGAFSLITLIFIFQIPVVIVFIGWGGLTNKHFNAYELSISPAHIIGPLSVAGFYFCIWIVSRLKSMSPNRIAALLLFLPLLVLGLPKETIEQSPESFTGLSTRLLEIASRTLGFDTIVLIVPAALLGLFLISFLLDKTRQAPEVFKLSVILILVGYASSSLLGETHIQLFMVITCMLIWAETRLDTWLKLVVVQCSIAGVLYTVYHALFKVHGIKP